VANAAAQTPDDDGLVGRVLDERYVLEAVLGEGGLGRVYRGRHLKLGRPVAVKVLLEEFRQASDVVQRFEREAQALSALHHPNIVTVIDSGVSDGLLFLVMELVEGEDLDAVVEREGALPIERAVGILTQVLRSLAYAHDKGVIHRDLKLGNVHVRPMPDGSEHVEVLDFGLAKFLDTSAPTATGATNLKLTRAGMIMGTPAYMAPEQVDGAACDTRTDVYAAGVMLFELLTGRLPFVYSEPTQMLRAHLVETPPPLRTIDPRIPPDLEAIVRKAMAKSPDERFRDGAEMLVALEAADLSPAPLEAVTGKLREYSAVLTDNVERLSGELSRKAQGLSEELGLSTQLDALRRRLPGPLRSLPPPVLFGVGAGALLLVAVVANVAATPSSPLTPDAALAPLPPGADLADLEQRRGLPAPRDPFADLTALPEPLREVYEVLEAGRWTRRSGRRYIGRLRRAARQAPSDCRPVLLQAHGFVSQRYLSGALPLYEEAFRRDPSCRGDPRMLRNLVMMAGTRTLERDAGAALIRIYGDEAENALAAAIEAERGTLPRHEATRQRWRRLLDQL